MRRWSRHLRETPPRAWGRPPRLALAASEVGNTPTSVGKTSEGLSSFMTEWKHPHERGEDAGQRATNITISETPPRAWGRQSVPCTDGKLFGNTPTSVGKTPCIEVPQGPAQKHPHERGEDSVLRPWMRRERETPPRAWGRRSRHKGRHDNVRNTPTSVGKTKSSIV